MMNAQSTAIRIVATALIAGVAGCVSVKPEKDYDRASTLIGERTGAAEVYDPAADSQVRDKVQAMLQDGLTVDEALSVALLNNHAFQSLFLEIGVSRADLVQSKLLTNPSLSLSARFPEGGGRSNLSFSLGQEIVDLWQIPVRKKMAQADLEETILDVVRAATELSAKVKNAYYTAVVTQQTAAIREENLKRVRHSLELAQHRFDAGEATILDVNLVKANVLDVQTQHIAARRDERTSKIALARLLGLSTPASILNLTDPLPSPTGILDDDATLTARALKARLDVQAAAAGEDKVFHWADATISGDEVLVSSPDVPKPIAVRYAWADNPHCNLYNGAGLPACPFRTDDWPGMTVDAK